MARNARVRRRLSASHRSSPYPISSYHWDVQQREDENRNLLPVQEMDWQDATCSVCMDYPHNAVLLLCSSHEKGCRPYMCGTSVRHSNCLDQFMKAYNKDRSTDHRDMSDNNAVSGSFMLGWPANEKWEGTELSCPLCRGQVKGFTVVEPAREYLNKKQRCCMQDSCSFVGTYKELRRHVRSEHPSAKTREVDPVLAQNWRTLEHERDRQDVISTIRSSMPRAVVFGDYVIEMSNSDEELEDGDGNFESGGRSLSRSILYFFLREGFVNLQRGSGDSRTVDDNLSSLYPVDVESDDGGGLDHTIMQGRGMGLLRSEGRRRQRRRRSRGRSAFDAS